MAEKNVFVHLDLNKQELQNAKAQNLTTAQRTTLAGTLVAADKGLFVYDTTLNKLFAWNGTAFENVTPAPPQVGQYRGGVAHTAAEPANLASGDYVVFTSAGFLTNFVPGAVVQIGDLAFYNGTTWDLVQGNVVLATESTAGVMRVYSTLSNVLAGDDNAAVSPLGLLAVLQSRTQVMNLASLVANTPTNFVHNLGSTFVDVVFYVNGQNEESELYWRRVNINTIEVTSNVTVSVDVVITKLGID